jgi:hypothetical protein
VFCNLFWSGELAPSLGPPSRHIPFRRGLASSALRDDCMSSMFSLA